MYPNSKIKIQCDYKETHLIFVSGFLPCVSAVPLFFIKIISELSGSYASGGKFFISGNCSILQLHPAYVF